jgi:hypothetical protein
MNIVRMPVYDERRGRFARLTNERVLIYWPHGFGDFVHFGYVAPLLETSNSYAITRFGDDFVHLYDGAAGIAPLYSGVHAIGDGSAQGARHLGIDWKRIRNRPADVMFPPALDASVRDGKFTTLLYTDYPEYEGKRAFPYHTKARALIRQLVDPARLKTIDMRQPLKTVLTFETPPDVRARIELRLLQFVEPAQHLYLIAPGGHTNADKVWPLQQVAALQERLPQFDSAARSLTIDEGSLRSNFGDLDVPFAHLLVTLIARAHAFIGAAAGPLHAALAMRRTPVLGIWLAHHPDWYDEPWTGALHLTGPLVHARHYARRKATRTLPAAWRSRAIEFPHRTPDANDVLEALALLS